MNKRFMVANLMALLFFAGCAGPAGHNREVAAPPGDSPGNARSAHASQPVRVSTGDTDAAEPAVAAAPDGRVYTA